MNRNTPWRTTRGSRIVALAQGHNDWYKIKNSNDGPAQLSIYDEIGFFGITAHDLISDLASITGPIDVHLNSPGGEVWDGLAIYNCLMARDAVTIYVDGIAASIASVIAMAGDKICIAPTAQMMVHNAFSMAIGDAKDLREMADRLEENTANISTIYAARTGLTADHWLGVMEKEGWYRGQEAVDAGLADELTELKVKGKAAVAASAANFDMSVYQRQPTANVSYAKGGILPKGADTVTGGEDEGVVQDAAHHPYHGRFDVHHEPTTGSHSHNHADFGFGDGDDGIHAHSHTHDNDAVHIHKHMSHDHNHGHEEPHSHAHEEGQENWGPHDHPHTHHVTDPDHDGDNDSSASGDTDHDYVLPDGSPGPAAMSNAAYDSTSWDGSAAMSSCHSASDFRSICAGQHSAGEPDQRQHWALPHHKHPGSPPNKAGVTAALGRLNQTQDLTNKSAAESHLKAHQRAWASDTSDEADTVIYSDADAAALLSALKG
jgi:ATP-dependent protease ClpP protease subunit